MSAIKFVLFLEIVSVSHFKGVKACGVPVVSYHFIWHRRGAMEENNVAILF